MGRVWRIGGPTLLRGACMEKNVESVMASLRRDLVRWREDLIQLRAEGKDDVAATVEKWIQEAERVLVRWADHPRQE
jgi:hypothetical protein